LITYQKEELDYIWDDLIINAKLHWEETEGYRHNQPFNPDKERFLHYAKLGFYHAYSARDDGELIANVTMYVSPSMHTQVLIATEDTMFVKPEYRGKRVYYKLFRFVEEEMQKMGAKEILLTSKVSNPAGGLLERMGYTLVANEYSKSFKSADSTITLN